MSTEAQHWRPLGLPTTPVDRAGETPGTLVELYVRLRDAGITIDRMSCADVAAQLSSAITRPIDTILCSVLDADSTAPLNTGMAREFPQDVQFAVDWLARGASGARRVFVIERGNAMPIARGADVVRIAHAYPQLHPSLLLRIALRRRLRPGRLPTEAGVIAIDAAAAWALGRLIRGEPPAVPVMVQASASSSAIGLLTSPSITLGELIDQAVSPAGRDLLIQAGPRLVHRGVDRFMRVADLGEWTIHLSQPTAPVTPDACIRCGWCRDVCPAGVKPVLLVEAAQAIDEREMIDLSARARLEECVRCGLCQYVCPSRLPLLAAIRRCSTAVHVSSEQQGSE